jgi:hypothetical protein
MFKDVILLTKMEERFWLANIDLECQPKVQGVAVIPSKLLNLNNLSAQIAMNSMM